MARKKNNNSFSFDFSALSFGGKDPGRENEREIPRLTYEPACFRNAQDMAQRISWESDYISFLAGTFVFGDFLEALLHEKRLSPDVMYITTLGMNKENIDSLVNLVKYLGCEKLNLIISHYFAGVERHKLIPYMEHEFSGLDIDMAVIQSHAKICLIRSVHGDGAIVGSANLSSSNNIEQMIILHDPSAIDYLQKQLDTIMDRFTVYRGLEQKPVDWSKNKGNVGLKAFEAMTEGGG